MSIGHHSPKQFGWKHTYSKPPASFIVLHPPVIKDGNGKCSDDLPMKSSSGPQRSSHIQSSAVREGKLFGRHKECIGFSSADGCKTPGEDDGPLLTYIHRVPSICLEITRHPAGKKTVNCSPYGMHPANSRFWCFFWKTWYKEKIRKVAMIMTTMHKTNWTSSSQ